MRSTTPPPSAPASARSSRNTRSTSPSSASAENGHVAFNDPPADFETESPYLVVDLDDACRRQQLGEGWFPTLEDVPGQAVSMSVRQILKSRSIICTVPDERKARAVKEAVEGEVSPRCPASVLRTHPDCGLFLDRRAASLLG